MWDSVYTCPKSEPALELPSRAAPSVEAHHRSDGPDTGRNSGGRRIIKTKRKIFPKFYFWGILLSSE